MKYPSRALALKHLSRVLALRYPSRGLEGELIAVASERLRDLVLSRLLGLTHLIDSVEKWRRSSLRHVTSLGRPHAPQLMIKNQLESFSAREAELSSCEGIDYKDVSSREWLAQTQWTRVTTALRYTRSRPCSPQLSGVKFGGHADVGVGHGCDLKDCARPTMLPGRALHRVHDPLMPHRPLARWRCWTTIWTVFSVGSSQIVMLTPDSWERS